MTISILGCGWLGFPLGQALLRSNHTVLGSTTSEKKLEILEGNGITPFLIQAPEHLDGDQQNQFWKSDLLFLNIPPGRRNPDVADDYPETIRAIRSKIESIENGIKNIIFASTTSVYPLVDGVYSEEDTDPEHTSRPSGKAVLKAEQILTSSDFFDTVVLRFGGLYGYDRHPVRYLSGKKNLSSPNKPVNLIHQDDCIGIVETILSGEFKTAVYNAVSDGHPPRKTFYQAAAEHYGLTPPTFDPTSESVNCVISNTKLKKELEYEFIYPNPLDHSG